MTNDREEGCQEKPEGRRRLGAVYRANVLGWVVTKKKVSKKVGRKGVGGRPTKYKPEYCEQIVAHMSGGASVTSFAAEIDVARSTINEWADVHPEFSEAVKRGKAKCASWWERVGRTQALEGGGNATLVIFGLKNMAGEDWRDKQEIDNPAMQSLADVMREIGSRSALDIARERSQKG